MDRRRFLVILAGAGGLCALDALGPVRRACTAAETLAAEGLTTATRTSWALGAEVRLTALHAERAVAERALDAALAELVSVQRVLSIYRPDSQLSRLNRDGRFAGAHPWLTEALTAARSMSERTGGAFDVTVQPLWEAWSQAQAAGGLPEPGTVAAARERVGFARIGIAEDAITLRDGAAVTLNGLAQGLAVDRVTAALHAHGIEHALVDTGELAGIGARRDGDPWRVGIQHPRRPEAYISLAHLDGRALATSGDYVTSFSADLAHHHIFDPATGDSPPQLAALTVAAATGIEADMLSTAAFVLGLGAGRELIASTPGADALFVDKDGRVLATSGFPVAPAGGEAR